jgi:uncharacterized protein YlzI (FlbEa/FlbD family)
MKSQSVFIKITVGSGMYRNLNVHRIETIEDKFPDNKESFALITMASGKQHVCDQTVPKVFELIEEAHRRANALI